MSAPTLADVATSCAAALGIRGFTDRLAIGEARHAVIVLVDGLGARLIADHAPPGTLLGEIASPPIRAVFPTTTVAALASLGTGLQPGTHGMVGGSFLLPDEGTVLAPLHWGASPHPLAVQPEPTVFEAAAAAGVQVASIAPGAYESSGLTRAVLRGGAYRPAEDIPSRIGLLADELRGDARALTYVYWPELDRIGHGSGVGSREWRAALERVDTLLRGIAELLGPDDVAVITADHGMVNIDERIANEADRALRAGVRIVAGEPRLRHLYTDESGATVAGRWRERLGAAVTVWTRDELVETGLLGPVDPALADRIGDVVVMAEGTLGLASVTDTTVSGLIGQHGALTPDEQEIPALILRG